MDRVGSWWDICPRVASYSGQRALGAVTRTPGSQRNVSWGDISSAVQWGSLPLSHLSGPIPLVPADFAPDPVSSRPSRTWQGLVTIL